MREAYGYPEITDTLRAKIFGQNATKPYGISAGEATMCAQNDVVEQRRANYIERKDPHHLTFGPKTRREFLLFKS